MSEYWTGPPAGLLIRGARLVPLSGADAPPAHPVDVLVEDGRVTAVGPEVERPPGAEEYDADGRWLMPGLWDAHVHLGQWTLARQRLDTSRLISAEEAVRLIAELVDATPGRPIVGWGHRPAGWPRPATVADLDAVADYTPVVLVAGDGHHAWLNTVAQHALGLPVREDMVREEEWFAAYDRLATLADGPGSGPAAYRETLDRAAALGVVGVVDFEFAGGVAGWQQRWSQGCDRLRVRAATYGEGLDDVIAAGVRTGDHLQVGDDRLTMGPLKIISDGSLNTHTAWCRHPYAAGGRAGDDHGAPNLTEAELHDLVARAHAAGLEVAAHAIGDAAVDRAITAFETSGATGSIEHVQLIERADAGRIAAAGLRASVQPHHLVDDRDVIEEAWPGRGDRCFAYAWLRDAGVRLALGSDAPVSPLDPWLAIDAAVRRTGDDRPAWHPEQALTRQQALAASVDGHPMVGEGSLADLVLLDQDPLDETAPGSPPAGSPYPGVALTVVAGQVVHRAP